MPDNFIDTCVTSPPYFHLRFYNVIQIWDGDPNCKHEWSKDIISKMSGGKGHKQDTNQGSWFENNSQFCIRCGSWRGELGQEPTYLLYIDHLVQIFREVRRVLKPEGTLWLNIGESYNGSGGAGGDYNKGGLREGQPKYPGMHLRNLKPKDMLGIPFATAFALRNDGWWLRSAPPWIKGNAFCSGVLDRPDVKIEYLFQLTKSRYYYYDYQTIYLPKKTHENREGGAARDRKKGYNSKLAEIENRKSKKSSKEKDKKELNQYRTRRSTDWFCESLDKIIEEFEDYLNHLKYVRENEGLLLDFNGDPLTFKVNTKPNKQKHYSMYPDSLIEPCILSSCPENGIVLDPFIGAGSTAITCKKLNRNYIGFDAKDEYCNMAEERLQEE